MYMQTMKRTPSGFVGERTGTEGPRHDPYSFTELVVVRHNHEMILHEGLAEWFSVDGVRFNLKNSRVQFEVMIGCSVRVLERALRTIRCKCGSKEFEWLSGFPGESLCQCLRCKNIVASTFNESAVL